MKFKERFGWCKWMVDTFHDQFVMLGAVVYCLTVLIVINTVTVINTLSDDVIVIIFTSVGANFSFHKEKARPMPEAGPVVRQLYTVLSNHIML